MLAFKGPRVVKEAATAEEVRTAVRDGAAAMTREHIGVLATANPADLLVAAWIAESAGDDSLLLILGTVAAMTAKQMETDRAYGDRVKSSEHSPAAYWRVAALAFPGLIEEKTV